MRGTSLISILLILMVSACLDRVFIDVGNDAHSFITIDGHISDEHGPYEILIKSGQELESKVSQNPISVKKLVISDNAGTSEVLTEISPGSYKTDSMGIQGKVGRVYKLRIELLDGRVYESLPDTLLPPGRVDSIYFSFKSEKSDQFTPLNGSDKYGFDVFFNSTAESKSKYYFLWNFKGTFQSDTHPENNMQSCVYVDGKCNYVPLCSGLVNIGGLFRRLVL